MEVLDSESCEADTVVVGPEGIMVSIDEELMDEDDIALGDGKRVLDGNSVRLGIGVEVGPWTF